MQRNVAGRGRGAVRADGHRGSKLVLGLVKGSKAVKDSRTDASVDLVLGEKYTKLAASPEGDTRVHHGPGHEQDLLTRASRPDLLTRAARPDRRAAARPDRSARHPSTRQTGPSGP